MTSITGTRRIVISLVVLALAGVVALMVVVLTRSASSGMAGMQHGSDDMSMSSPAATTSADPHAMDGPAPTGPAEMQGMDMSGGEHSSEATPSVSPTTSADAHGEMPGMDMSGGEHGSEATPSASPTTSADAHGEMPGMDMPAKEPGSGDSHGTDPGHVSMAEEASPARPLVPVLSTFGGGTSAVLLAAGFLRRKDRLRNQAKSAARAARRSAK